MEISKNIVVNTPVVNAPNKSPWGTSQAVAPCSLATVMDEEVAKEMQAKEDYLAGYHLQANSLPSGLIFEGNEFMFCLL